MLDTFSPLQLAYPDFRELPNLFIEVVDDLVLGQDRPAHPHPGHDLTVALPGPSPLNKGFGKPRPSPGITLAGLGLPPPYQGPALSHHDPACLPGLTVAVPGLPPPHQGPALPHHDPAGLPGLTVAVPGLPPPHQGPALPHHDPDKGTA